MRVCGRQNTKKIQFCKTVYPPISSPCLLIKSYTGELYLIFAAFQADNLMFKTRIAWVQRCKERKHFGSIFMPINVRLFLLQMDKKR